MGISAVIQFENPDCKTIEARVYNHYDGYPGGEHGVLAMLRSFFDTVSSQTRDTRFYDPSYLAAKLIVFLARGYAHRFDPATGTYKLAKPLDFPSIGIVNSTVDAEYVYTVHCTDERVPLVSWSRVATSEGSSGIDVYSGLVKPSPFWSNVFNE